MIGNRVFRTAAPVLVAAFGLATAGQAAPYNQRVIPANTVVHVKLDEKLSGKDARRGEKFTATLDDEDRSGFPRGTHFEGVVTEVQHPSKQKPGVMDVQFRRAILPGGTAVAFSGDLTSLDDKDVKRTSSGRLESRHSGGKFETKWVGYGAAGGAVLSTIFGGKLLNGALLGALGGAAYSYLNKDKQHKYSDVELSRGTDFGIRVNNRVAFADSARYRSRS